MVGVPCMQIKTCVHVCRTCVASAFYSFAKHTITPAGHCKRLAPTWKELAAAYKGHDKVAIAHVDCTVSRDVCQTAGVRKTATWVEMSMCWSHLWMRVSFEHVCAYICEHACMCIR